MRLFKRFFYFLIISAVSFYFIYYASNDGKYFEASVLPSFKPAAEPTVKKAAPFNLTPNQSESELAQKIESYFAKRNKQSVFDGTVLFAKNGRVVYKGAFGKADQRMKIDNQLTTRFQLASVSKQFTAFAIMLLKQRGHLNYSDPVSKYIKGFPYEDITIEHLLTHRSGLANYNYFADKYWTDKKRPIKNKDVVKMMLAHTDLTYCKPGARFHYCNTNYALLASIVESISGMTFKHFMESQVFNQLQMYNTKIFSFSDTVNFKDAAKGHLSNNRLYSFDYQDEVAGDKGVYSTAEDMYIWDQYLYTNDFLKQSEIAKAFEPGGDWQGRHNYGYGWRLFKKNNSDDYYTFHFGWWHGFRSYFIRLPENQGTIIVLNNSMRGSFLLLNNLVAMLEEN